MRSTSTTNAMYSHFFNHSRDWVEWTTLLIADRGNVANVLPSIDNAGWKLALFTWSAIDAASFVVVVDSNELYNPSDTNALFLVLYLLYYLLFTLVLASTFKWG